MASDVLARLRQILDAEPRIREVGPPIALAFDDRGSITVDGEVASVAAKRLAIDRVTRFPDAITVVDRLRVAPVRRFTDEQIRRGLLDLFVEEPAFSDCEFVSAPRRAGAGARRPSTKPRIEFHVADGIVTLTGRTTTLLHKRLAGVFAWWTPGSRDVLNLLEAEPSAPDGDEQIVEAVSMVLDRDPLISTSPDVSVHDAVVSLSGTMANSDESEAAEEDAWCVFGTRDVVNSIRSRH